MSHNKSYFRVKATLFLPPECYLTLQKQKSFVHELGYVELFLSENFLIWLSQNNSAICKELDLTTLSKMTKF